MRVAVQLKKEGTVLKRAADGFREVWLKRRLISFL